MFLISNRPWSSLEQKTVKGGPSKDLLTVQHASRCGLIPKTFICRPRLTERVCARTAQRADTFPARLLLSDSRSALTHFHHLPNTVRLDGTEPDPTQTPRHIA
ncbi:hypothetical protein SKAU_G00355110 [Synaphobranchus kaupii]|uniref:Uncharacterized protein n=1 Tax=Synaphobranchus kaupii TaxID=118154 RepID=A0A9Q1EH81_SYNKA|nr:hypothetical protein SKAU_G00355110 [Synaphobranchus kaupii]